MKNWTNYLILLILIVLTIMLTKIYIEVKSDGGQCLQNPLLYAAKEYNEVTESELTCSCSFANPKYAPFTFDKDGIRVITLTNPEDKLNINISGIEDIFGNE